MWSFTDAQVQRPVMLSLPMDRYRCSDFYPVLL